MAYCRQFSSRSRLARTTRARPEKRRFQNVGPQEGRTFARQVGARKTAKVIAIGCYDLIFASAIAEISASELVAALAEVKNPRWAYRALRAIPNLTEPQRERNMRC